MDGPTALDEEYLGLEVGQQVLRGVRLDPTASAVVSYAESPVEDPWAFSPGGSVDPNRIRQSLEGLLDALGVPGRPLVAVGISIGPRFSGVGSGPSLEGWLKDQAERVGQDLVFAGETGVAFAPRDAVWSVVEAAGKVGLELSRVDLAPVAGARLLARRQDTVIVGSGRGWQARLRDFEVVEALAKNDVGADAPFQILDADGSIRQLSGYRQVAISPGFRAAGFSPGQMAVSVGAAIGVAYQSPANLLDGTVVSRHRAPVVDDPFAGDPVGGGAAPDSGGWSDGPARFESPVADPAGSPDDAFWAPAHRDQLPVWAARNEVVGSSTATARINLLIGLLAVLAIVLIPVYLLA